MLAEQTIRDAVKKPPFSWRSISPCFCLREAVTRAEAMSLKVEVKDLNGSMVVVHWMFSVHVRHTHASNSQLRGFAARL